MMSNIKLSIVSPVYRAEKMVHMLVERIVKSVTTITKDFEIILVNDASPGTLTKTILDDLQERAQWENRWQAQLRKAEVDAPIDPKTKKRKIYIKFDCYVRSKVWRGLV